MKKRSWPRRLAILAGFFLFLTGISAGILYYLYQEHVVRHPGEHLEREDILRRISRESPVFYRDGEHKLGVFFGAEHRQYVKYEELPEAYIHAIVAAEDKNFFQHPGIDIKGIARAMVANIKARKVVAGGSTITQQTAKNLYYREERTFSAKWEELINALRLEAHYSKQEILEFYINQFHVHSNGRGLGIAARYFFDKKVGELSVLECAFLAGVVKGPSRYNPFIGRTEEKRELAKARSRRRTNYVLERMHAAGYLSAADLNALEREPLEFKKGDFRYDQNVILDYVFDQLQDERFTKLLEEHGIDNPAVAGIRVFTTIDQEYQQAAEYGLRHNLTSSGVLLEGLTVETFRAPSEHIMPIEKDALYLYGYYKGKVVSAQLEGAGAPALDVDLGGVTGRVNTEGLQRVADLLKQAEKKNTWVRAGKAEIRAVAEGLAVDDNVLVSVNGFLEDGRPSLDLECPTELQGAVVILDRGRIRAMVGGQDNRNFNRATNAARQLGSTHKPVTYAAAFTLDWGAMSPLDNRRQGFRFQRQWYWPRPDHDGVKPYVSIVQAGETSENLASVSLLYHLTDRLDDDQMIDLAHRVGMAPEVGDSTVDFVKRIRDVYGILPNDDSRAEGLFNVLKREMKVELAFNGRMREVQALETLPYGLGFEDEIQETRRNVKQKDEQQARLEFLEKGFLQLEQLAPQALEAAQTILDASRRKQPPGMDGLPDVFHKILGRDSTLIPERRNPQSERKKVDPAKVQAALEHFYTRQVGQAKRLIYSKRGNPDWGKPTQSEVVWLLTSASPEGSFEAPGGSSSPSTTSGSPDRAGGEESNLGGPGEGHGASAGDHEGADRLKKEAGETGTLQNGTGEFAGGTETLAGRPADMAGTEGAKATGANNADGGAEKASGADTADGLTEKTAGAGGAEGLTGGTADAGSANAQAGRPDEAGTGAPSAGGTPSYYDLAELDPAEVILLEDTLSPATVKELREGLDRRLEESPALDKYDINRLIHNQEFRIMAGLQYVIRMMRTMGVRSELKAVLPMTLGANDITLLEAAMMYQTFLEGKVYGFGGEGPEAGIIERIEDPIGRTIYQLVETGHQALDPAVGTSVGRILRQVVDYGTGRGAQSTIRISSPDPNEDKDLEKAGYIVPVFGKTGTTNDYINAAFVGFVPAPRQKGPDLPYGQALTIAAYVGYDKNRPMKRGSIRAQGSSGALPVWIDTARGVVRDLRLAGLIDPEVLAPGKTVPILWPRDMAAVAIDAETGLQTGSGVLIPDETVPEGCVPYEIYGVAEGSGWRERETFRPFTPWGEKSTTSVFANFRPEPASPRGPDVPANSGQPSSE